MEQCGGYDTGSFEVDMIQVKVLAGERSRGLARERSEVRLVRTEVRLVISETRLVRGVADVSGQGHQAVGRWGGRHTWSSLEW